jgi:hypothetical protein
VSLYTLCAYRRLGCSPSNPSVSKNQQAIPTVETNRMTVTSVIF